MKQISDIFLNSPLKREANIRLNCSRLFYRTKYFISKQNDLSGAFELRNFNETIMGMEELWKSHDILRVESFLDLPI